MKSMLAAGLLAALAITPVASAKADVIYTFAGTSTPGSVNSVAFNIELILTSATSGFGVGGSGRGPVAPGQSTIGGNVDRFVRLTVGEDVYTPTFFAGSFSVALSFDSLGAVTSTNISVTGENNDVRLTGTGSTASGFVGRETSSCTVSLGNCGLTGSWSSTTTPVAVPEPMSIALFGAGLAGLALARRRKA